MPNPAQTPQLTSLTVHDPRTAGPYRLHGRLGQGGQGVVYLGTDPADRQVAVKMLTIDLEHDPKAKARFGKEIAAARRVAPFCTAQILHADLDGEHPYVVSEFIEGPTLHRQVRDHGPVSGNALYRLAVGTATAIAAIHHAGIVHCDLKPDNVILGADGPRVIDFGIARAMGTHTLTGNVMGTVPYMAPERFHNVDIGPRCDIFGWAATIAFAASGRGPFGHDSLATVMARVLHEPPDLANLSGTLLDLVGEGLAKDQYARPTAEQILLRLLGHTAQPAAEIPLGAALREGSDAAATSVLPATAATGTVYATGTSTTAAPPPAYAQTTAVVPVPAPTLLTVPPAGWPRRLGRQAGDPVGISAAILLGAGGFAAGLVAAADTATAATMGAVAFGTVYLVRLVLAAALDRGEPDPSER
ncbi:hypothetical protein Cs7R123_01880 [Catellatospora sp. TT07R-123]|uniref:serine/threonine protein kinase n=1 Tax=Catellatospora sp. TT07R-123 TaxID=2733863 RepID=UPI001B1893E1|nr:serine/threonine-protein kinase [Catellatospora sp. TT07R-123]GHJ42846.1 hypothetical protein Cs7R123_01880 [Catellatospora sp. TT07R-123]